MSEARGSVCCSDDATESDFTPVPNCGIKLKRPDSKEASSKVVQQRRRLIPSMNDLFHAEQRQGMRTSNNAYLSEVLHQWDNLHSSRYLISPFADCFVNSEGHLNHGTTSRVLKYSVSCNRDIFYPMNEIHTTDGQRSSNGFLVSPNVFRAGLPPYASMQLDVMNALHYRGDTGQRGTSLAQMVTGKMKSVLRPWVTGLRAQRLTQAHLHIDDPRLVLPQKIADQKRRDKTRSTGNEDSEDVQRVTLSKA